MPSLFVEHMTVIDCAYLHAQRGLLGESWIVDLVLEGALDEQGMVLDFGIVKRAIKQAIDDGVDHKLIVPMQAPGLSVDGDALQFDLPNGSRIRHRSPPDAIYRLAAAEVSKEAVTAQLETELAAVVPANVSGVRIRLREEVIDGAQYLYCHGLKKHDGNCQRIAHGHRSRIVIERNGERDRALETDIAERWRDIYLGTQDDLVGESDGQLHFAYDAPQGRFELSLPAARCDLIDSDSTVEHLAEVLLVRLVAKHPSDQITVRAYEGVNKGAIASNQ